MMKDGSRFGLVDTFDIDDGELLPVTAAEAFVLGVEWSKFVAKLDATSGPFSEMVHPENEARLTKVVRRRGRSVHSRRTGRWVEVEVGSTTPN